MEPSCCTAEVIEQLRAVCVTSEKFHANLQVRALFPLSSYPVKIV